MNNQPVDCATAPVSVPALRRAAISATIIFAAVVAGAITGLRAHRAEAPLLALDGEQALGVALLLLSYVLSLAVGLLLVRRKRTLAARAAAVVGAPAACEPAALWADCALYDPLAGVGVDFGAAAFGAAAVRRAVDDSTQTLAWKGAQGDDTECVVCLADVDVGEQCRVLKCSHVFHTQCADLWLVTGRKNACPTCSAVVCPERDHDMRVKGN